MRLVLVGAGIGGLTAALSMPAGVRVTLVEQAETLREAGAGLQLSPNATRVLHGLGLEPALAAVAFEPRAAEVRAAADGRLLLRQPLGQTARARWGAPYLHVHRADLQALLLEAVLSRPGVELRTGARLAGVEQDSDSATAVLETGERLAADALIGCDGLRSQVRAHLWGEDRPRYTGHTAWRGTVDAARLPPGLVAPVAAVWAGPGRHFVHYYVAGGSRVNFVGVVERDEGAAESWTARGDPAELARDFAGWPDPVRAIVAAAVDPLRWALYDRAPSTVWSRGRVSLLGDAAHPMPPFMAQGAAMAIEDAQALGRALAGSQTVEAALRRYEAERRPRTLRVQAASRRNGALFHLPQGLGRMAFGAAATLDRFDPSGGSRRFDWLYGWGASA